MGTEKAECVSSSFSLSGMQGENGKTSNEKNVPGIEDEDMSLDWMKRFKTLCRNLNLRQSSDSLPKLVAYFSRNVSKPVRNSYHRPSEAAKLKDLIKEALMLFMYIHRFEEPQTKNRELYLNQMSDLLAMYIDMKLASWKSDIQQSSCNEIATRLISCLYLYLENSSQHLLDTLMKVELMDCNYYKILDPIINKVLKTVPQHPESEVMYVRYLLIYRLWKKIHSNKIVKEQITATAIASLGSLPENIPNYFVENVLPKPTNKAESTTTKFCLCQNFDEKRSCEIFLEHCRKSAESEAEEIEDKKDQRNSGVVYRINRKLAQLVYVILSRASVYEILYRFKIIKMSSSLRLGRLLQQTTYSSKNVSTKVYLKIAPR